MPPLTEVPSRFLFVYHLFVYQMMRRNILTANRLDENEPHAAGRVTDLRDIPLRSPR